MVALCRNSALKSPLSTVTPGAGGGVGGGVGSSAKAAGEPAKAIRKQTARAWRFMGSLKSLSFYFRSLAHCGNEERAVGVDPPGRQEGKQLSRWGEAGDHGLGEAQS